MILEDFGYNQRIEALRAGQQLNTFELGRVISEHKGRYTVRCEKGIFDAEITGNLRFSALSREDYPAVGDWVALNIYEPDFSIIHSVIPRFSTIARQAPGAKRALQVIAANVDYALLIQAVDRDFNLNRLERYLTICNSSRVNPIIVLTKTDLIGETAKTALISRIKERINDVPVLALSNVTGNGLDELTRLIEKGKTYCLLGSSGVGKSTLINSLSGKQTMSTGAICQHSNRGRHVTSHRQLIVLENGGLLIDNPGMREVGVVDTNQGLETTFDDIVRLSENCKFSDCTHTIEAGCAVLKAVENGTIDPAAHENYLKLEKEKAFFETSLIERKKKEKMFGKTVKDYYKKKVKGKEQ
ncbi:MAG: ribosome small subunit-dependent GTPase A [Bacteroidetes bacterium HGW-Bacteroidetes-4]|jgi:ribosome biogenesis GTPase|nr:MAG: ribosome small subunit-dependent GTPase A [Bacteroidetes bacterium HGW-Bacteroidetes-4]